MYKHVNDNIYSPYIIKSIGDFFINLKIHTSGVKTNKLDSTQNYKIYVIETG